MEGISKYLRLRTATVVVALATAAVALAAAGSANALVFANNISIRVIDNTPKHSISAAYCPNGHAMNIEYALGTRADPCNYTPFVVPFISANGGRYPEGAWPSDRYDANPLGVVVRFRFRDEREPLYFYAKNPIIGLPFFEAAYGGGPRHTVSLVEGEVQDRQIGPTWVRFHRGGDVNGGLNNPSYKVMTIEICGSSPKNCRG